MLSCLFSHLVFSVMERDGSWQVRSARHIIHQLDSMPGWINKAIVWLSLTRAAFCISVCFRGYWLQIRWGSKADCGSRLNLKGTWLEACRLDEPALMAGPKPLHRIAFGIHHRLESCEFMASPLYRPEGEEGIFVDDWIFKAGKQIGIVRARLDVFFSALLTVTAQAQCLGFILFHAFPPSILPSLAIARRRNWHCCILLFNSFRWSLVFYLQNQTFPPVLSARVRIEKATLVREKCLGGDCFFGKTNVYPRAKRKSFTKGHVKYPPPPPACIAFALLS